MTKSHGKSLGTKAWQDIERAVIDRYTFVGWLGAGAFGDVLEARQKSTGQSVAIKVLRVREHENTSRRFVREMRACAALHHPNIVRVLDAGGDEESDHPLYTIFEHVPGETLARRLAREEMLPVDEALGLMMQVLDALQCAHSAGIVHRDLKPSNIMVTETAGGLQAKILDFGVAGFVDDARQSFNIRLTRSDERMGTPAYCAPEQLRGEPTTVRVDYYAWGLVLLECLTGASAFGARTLPEVLHAQFSREPVPLPAILAEHKLGEVLRWVLEKDPARRASDARLILERIRQIEARELVDGSGFLRVVGASSGEDPLPPTETALLAHPASERCPTTALCCRVALLRPVSQPDEEALDEWLNDLRDLVTQTAQNHGAISAGCAGSELLFYFGVGSGEEASARRAIRAAIDIRDHCARRSSVMRVRLGWEVDVRLGVHSGMATMSAQERQPIAGLGSTSLVAARLSQLCDPGDIAVSEAARASVPDFVSIECVAADADADAGWESWYRVSDIDLSTPSSRRPPTSNAPTLGRRELLRALDRAWKEDKDGLPQCIVLTGVPGIGKSHLARSWCAGLAASGASVLESHCFPETEGNALHPILRLLREQLRIAGTGPAEESRVLEAFLVEKGIDPLSAMPLLSAWLGLPGARWPELAVSPMKRRQMFLELMVRLVKCLVSGPTVLFVEDLHWADPTTVEWMCKLCQTPFEERLVLLCTTRMSDGSARPLKSPNVPGDSLGPLFKLPSALSIEVPPLVDSAARELLTSMWDSPKLDEKLLNALVERGAGVPLFLLELARYRDALGDAIPASIKELLIARIDQLGRAKETAQLAAIIDPEFDYELLEELSQRREGLLGDINHLETAGILRRAPDGRYSFTHALVRECAHLSVPKKDRQRLHAGVIAALYRRYPDLKASKPWLLALHHRDAEQWKQALEAGEAAATAALMRFDNLETLGYVEELKGRRGRTPATSGWLRHITDESERHQIELRLLALEATALMMTRGWADLELNETCRRASELFDHAPVESTIQLRYALAQFYFNRGLVIDDKTGRDRARPYIDDLIQSADRTGAKPLVKLGRMMLGAWYLFHGNVDESLQTLRLVDGSGAAEDAWKFGFDAQIGARSVEGMARWFQGDPEVRAFSDETMRMAKALEHPASYGIAQLYRASLDQLMGDRDATRQRCADLLALCERHGLQGYPGYALILLGWADNEPEAAHNAREALTMMGQRLTEAYYGALIAEAELCSANFAGAWQRLQLVEETARTSGEHFYVPRILFLKARTAKHVGIDEEEADRFVAEGLIIAADQGARGMCASIVRDYAAELGALPAASRAKRRERLLEATDGPHGAAIAALLRESV